MTLTDLLTIPIAIILIAGWTAAWLSWLFYGEVRHWLTALMPETWRVLSPQEILDMDTNSLELHLVALSKAPRFVVGVMLCPRCMSAHVAVAGTLIVAFATDLPILITPLMWATGAYVGLNLHTKISK